jgi:hypothetical protein
VASEVRAAAATTDILMLGRMGRSLVTMSSTGSTVRSVVSQAQGLTLILQHGARLRPPVIVVFDGSMLARKALRAAAAIAPEDEGTLTVLLPADTSERVAAMLAKADGLLRGGDLQVRYRALTKPSVPRLTGVIQEEGGGTVVMPAQSSLLEGDGLQALLDNTGVPVLLVGR